MVNLVRISKVNDTPNFPVRASTLYKWRHLGRFPEIFVDLGGGAFVNLDRLDEVVRGGGLQIEPAGKKPRRRSRG